MTPQAITAALAGPGWCVIPDYLNWVEVTALREECLLEHAAGTFHPAGVGSGQAKVWADIRGDQVRWIDETEAGPALKIALIKLEALRLEINRNLFLGLFDVELHFAAYPPRAGYRRHLDRFQDDDRRALTIILYLNQDWQANDGGLLRFWPEDNGCALEIEPIGGTLVTFLSERFWHEVTATQRQRLSLTGWFRHR